MTMGEALWVLFVLWAAAAWATALTLLARWVIRRAR
jgi:hypothetical protein